MRNVVCVADRGLLSNDNLQALQEAGMYYIVGAQLKKAQPEVTSALKGAGNLSNPNISTKLG